MEVGVSEGRMGRMVAGQPSGKMPGVESGKHFSWVRNRVST